MDPLTVAENLFAAITRGDVAAVRALYTAETVVWHNTDQHGQTAEQNLRVLEWMVANVRELRYEEIRRHRTETGFVQQHVLRGIAPSGAAFAIPACMVGMVADGRIVRLEEYFDSAQLAPLLEGGG